MSYIYQEILTELEADRPVVLATVVRRRGSAPRGLGTKMLLKHDRAASGTIGGGCLEAQTLDDAAKVFVSRRARMVEFDLMGDEAAATGMICGGMVDVYLEYFSPGDAVALEDLRRLTEMSHRGEPAAVAVTIDLDRSRGRRFIWRLDTAAAWPEGEWPAEIADYRAKTAERSSIRPRNLGSFYVEPVRAAPTVYIFGGGHVSAQIAPLAAMVDFRVVVIDDRAEFADPERFPSADEVRRADFETVVDELDLGPAAYLVIVTRGHEWDHLILEKTLRKPTAYIGMIGSRRKRDLIYQDLLGKGFTREDLDRVHSPIGLDIKAETPEEIAVSIVAELIQTRAEKTGSPFKTWQV